MVDNLYNFGVREALVCPTDRMPNAEAELRHSRSKYSEVRFLKLSLLKTHGGYSTSQPYAGVQTDGLP